MVHGEMWKTYDGPWWGPHEVIDVREAFVFGELTEFISPMAIVWTVKEL